MSLKEYQRKRKFDRTPEPPAGKPRGKKARSKGALRFVVQKHDATREHYDFRLEFDGALKSWAVPKGPTLTSGDPRLAVHVEDHPLDYGTFEGVIPKGNYGAGTVMVWDTGTFVERGSTTRAESETALVKAYAEGHLTFILSGEKLRGEFALIKIKKPNAGPKAWLLIKKHDAEASRIDVLKQDRSAVTGRTMDEIAAQAEAKGQYWLPGKGRSKTTGKKPVARKPEKPTKSSDRSRPANQKPAAMRVTEPVFGVRAPEGDFVFEAFGVGVRALAEVSGGKVRLVSRSGLNLEPKHPGIVAALRKLKAVTLDGELVREASTTHFIVSDLLVVDGKDLRAQSLESRRRALEKLALPAPFRLAERFAAVPADRGKARVWVAKRAGSPYPGGLSKDWVRFRPMGGAALGGDKPPVSHPDKLYWPDEKITKGDLIAYYDSVADAILPHLVDRPQSLHRQPDGIRNEGFFHKDMTSYLPRRIQTVHVPSASSGKTINYVLCQDKWSLLYLVNLGCIELNPWLSKRDKLENPLLVVIDLDPDDNSFNEVVKIALEVRKVLTKVGADSWCKTSGSSGLHICIPTGGKYDFDVGREFAESVCRVVQRKFPKLTSVERNPAKRLGRIYLDFLQNRRGQTLAAPYCVRPKPGATVSAPLKWSEVKKGLSPKAFTIRNMAKRVARLGDLWKPILEEQVDLVQCRKQLSKFFDV